MRRFISGLVTLLLIASSLHGQTSRPMRVLMHRGESLIAGIKDRPFTLTVPAETEVDIQLLSGLHTKITDVDEPVRAQLLRPVVVNGCIALPSGSFLDGRVIKVRPAAHLHRPGELALRFEQITLPNGDVEPISAVLTSLDHAAAPRVHIDSEGYLKGGRAITWKGIAGGMLAVGAVGALKFGAASSGVFIGPWLPATGGALMAYEIFWPRGDEVHVPPDTYARIRLNYPLKIRVSG